MAADAEAPAPDQVEVTVFGPGYGESIVIHVPGGEWIVVDSCAPRRSAEPAALEYLRRLGVDLEDVAVLVVTHWHDDHIRGASQIAEACPNAIVVCSAAMNTREFGALRRLRSNLDTDSWEIDRVLRSDREVRYALASRRVWRSPAGAELWCLSPSDRVFQAAMQQIAELLPQPGAPRLRQRPVSPNHLSTVLWLNPGLSGTGTRALLLGADLQQTGSSVPGWSLILQDPPDGSATVFKIPHHGSSNAHLDEVWTTILEPDPVAVVTPFRRGRVSLPTPEDLQRVRERTSRGYLTSNDIASAPRIADRVVRDELGRLNARRIYQTGQVTVRYTSDGEVTVTAHPPAVHIDEPHSPGS